MKTLFKTLQHLLTPTTLTVILLLPNVGRTQQFYYGITNGTVTVTAYTGPMEVVIPPLIEGLPVTGLAQGCFFCSGYTSLSIPATLTNLAIPPVAACAEMTNITVDPDNPCYSSRDGVLFNKSQTTLIAFPIAKCPSYVIPQGVTTIAECAFGYSRSLATVTIPDSVASIGAWAFNNCCFLTNATLPSSLLNIGDCAFIGCPLQGLTIPEGVTNIGSNAFEQCPYITNLTIPRSVRTLGYGAFAMCTNLTTVRFNGDAPAADASVLQETPATVFYLPGTIGWRPTFGGTQTAPWHLPNPLILSSGPSFGFATNAFGFTVSWATNVPVVVEASATALAPMWLPMATNTLVDGWTYYADPEWASHPARLYRVRSY